LGDRVEQMVTKDEFGEFKEEFRDGQDKVVKMLTNIQAEQTATTSALMRHDGRIDLLEEDVKKIKLKLKKA
jgi:hypothetical protein